jgi:small subunit ribosomal protein S20
VANSRSARKRIRSSERKRVRNRIVRSAVRTRIGRVRRSLVSGQLNGVEEELRAAVKELDKAAEKGILHRNNVARRKSRIMAMAARLTLSGGSEEERAATRAAATGGAKGRTTRAAAGAAPTAGAAKAAATKTAATGAMASAKAPAAKRAAATKPAAAKPGVAPAGRATPKAPGSTRRAKGSS